MAKIIDSLALSFPQMNNEYFKSDICTICECEFSLDDEGGVSGVLQRQGAVGHIGIILVVFCPTCHAGLHDMYTAWYGKDEDGQIVLQSDDDLEDD